MNPADPFFFINANSAARGRMESSSSLILELIFSSIGLGYFIYGKKQKSIVPLLSGIGLMLFPYMVSNVVLILLLGIFLAVIPAILKF